MGTRLRGVTSVAGASSTTRFCSCSMPTRMRSSGSFRRITETPGDSFWIQASGSRWWNASRWLSTSSASLAPWSYSRRPERRAGTQTSSIASGQITTSVVVAPVMAARFPDDKGGAMMKGRSGIPDLQTQLESLFDQVWRSEADWQLWNRIDAAVEQQMLRERRTPGTTSSDAPEIE